MNIGFNRVLLTGSVIVAFLGPANTVNDVKRLNDRRRRRTADGALCVLGVDHRARRTGAEWLDRRVGRGHSRGRESKWGMPV